MVLEALRLATENGTSANVVAVATVQEEIGYVAGGGARTGTFGLDPDVELRVVRLGLDYSEDEDGRVRILVDDQEALEQGNTPAFRMELGRTAARALVAQIGEVVAAGRPLCPLCGRALEGDGQHFCPGSNGHSGDEEIPAEGEDEDFPSND